MLQPDSLRFSSDSSRAEQFYPDNSPVDIKVPSRKVVDSLKKDRDFSYLRTVARDDSWWIRFWEWLGSLFTRAASDSSGRSEEHTSELQSLMRTSYAVFCLK